MKSGPSAMGDPNDIDIIIGIMMIDIIGMSIDNDYRSDYLVCIHCISRHCSYGYRSLLKYQRRKDSCVIMIIDVNTIMIIIDD